MRLLTALFGLALIPGAALAQETEIRVVLQGPLGTRTSHKGDRVFARVAQPDALKGDEVQGTVNEVHSGGKLRGGASLNFSFDTLQHAGQSVPISTQIKTFQNSKGNTEVDEEGRIIRRGGGNAGKAVAGTGVGGLIGGLAGGLKGAAIGAGVGAAASIAVIEIVADAPEIQFNAGSSFTLSARSRGNPALTDLAPAAPATATAPAAPAPTYAPTPGYAAPAAVPAAASPATAPGTTPAAAGTQPNFTALNDDFIPGEKLLLYDDFTDMAPDEAPPHWKVRGSSPTLMAAGGVRQLSVGYRTYMTPSIKVFPKNFTVETEFTFDLKESADASWYFFPSGSGDETLRVVAAELKPQSVRLMAHTDKEALLDTDFPIDTSKPIKEAIWVQNGRIRVYFDGRKAMDVNQVELQNIDHAILLSNFIGDQKRINYRVVRVAESTPDFSRSILATGRYVTHGILFDTNSDHLKPESAAVIKNIAGGLQLNADLKLSIEGHTDSTGHAAANLDLSKRRAEAVKQVLVAQFQIDPARLTTDGFGADKPVDGNDTPQGRAQNRRVEFVKQ